MKKAKGIKFGNDDLLEALSKHFKIPKKDINFWHITDVFEGEHQICC